MRPLQQHVYGLSWMVGVPRQIWALLPVCHTADAHALCMTGCTNCQVACSHA